MNLQTPSRSSFDWQPGLVRPVSPLRSRASLNRAIEDSRSSSDWRGLGARNSTAEQIAAKVGVPVPEWAKRGVHWTQALGSQFVVPSTLSGLGDVSSQQINALASTGASTTVGILAALGTVSGPVGAIIGGLISVGSLIANAFHGCGQTCVQATNIANQVGTYLGQNLSTYMSAPVHYASLQAAALNNFDTAWAAMVKACSDPSLGSAGQRCITDRQAGSCKYHTAPCNWINGKYVPCGANGSGTSCWNWFVGMRDPIANDPTVVPDPVSSTTPATTAGTGGSAGSPNSSILPASSPNLTPLLVIGGLVLLVALL